LGEPDSASLAKGDPQSGSAAQPESSGSRGNAGSHLFPGHSYIASRRSEPKLRGRPGNSPLEWSHEPEDDFVFELTHEEILGISQTAISLQKLKFSKQVRAFTEHGALMAANVLNSARAVAMSFYVMTCRVDDALLGGAGDCCPLLRHIAGVSFV
jgi:hypothetical protein